MTMPQVARFWLMRMVLGALLPVFLLVACGTSKKDDNTPAAATSPGPTPTGTPPPTNQGNACGANAAGSGAASAAVVAPPATAGTTSASSLALNTVVTYQGQIQAELQAHCVSCHAVTPPNLSTPASVQQNSQQIAAAVAGHTMPQGAPLPQAEIDLFAQWASGGFLMTDASGAAGPAGGVPTLGSAPAPGTSSACPGQGGLPASSASTSTASTSTGMLNPAANFGSPSTLQQPTAAPAGGGNGFASILSNIPFIGPLLGNLFGGNQSPATTAPSAGGSTAPVQSP